MNVEVELTDPLLLKISFRFWQNKKASVLNRYNPIMVFGLWSVSFLRNFMPFLRTNILTFLLLHSTPPLLCFSLFAGYQPLRKCLRLLTPNCSRHVTFLLVIMCKHASSGVLNYLLMFKTHLWLSLNCVCEITCWNKEYKIEFSSGKILLLQLPSK